MRGATALLAFTLLAGPFAALAVLLPFELRDVQLANTSLQAKAAASNMHYLLDTLHPDRLLWNFRRNANLPTPGKPYAGSWEDPSCELRGHFTGHYLSALASVVMSTGEARAQVRLDLLVSELSKVQDALGKGYLSAFPSEHFDRVESLKGVWAPYYVIHKIMQGLLDAHLLGGNQQALEVVSAMADYHHARTAKVIADKGKEHWIKTLETEFGGMNEVMYRLYRVSKKDEHLELATWFDKPSFYEPLQEGKDVLPFRHANTHLAQVVGYAERYESTNDDTAKQVVENFFTILLANHTFATGGSNWKEFWFAPGTLGEAVLKPENAVETQEICTQFNILKIARSLFRWTGDIKYADFYEQALTNGILGVSRLSSDEVLGQELDNMHLIERLMHKATHGNHDHAHGAQAQGQGDHAHAGASSQDEQLSLGHHTTLQLASQADEAGAATMSLTQQQGQHHQHMGDHGHHDLPARTHSGGVSSAATAATSDAGLTDEQAAAINGLLASASGGGGKVAKGDAVAARMLAVDGGGRRRLMRSGGLPSQPEHTMGAAALARAAAQASEAKHHEMHQAAGAHAGDIEGGAVVNSAIGHVDPLLVDMPVPHGRLSGVSWSDGGFPPSLQGSLQVRSAPTSYWHRLNAYAHATTAQRNAISMTQEPSAQAKPNGELLRPVHTLQVAEGSVEPWSRVGNWRWQAYWGYDVAHMESQALAANPPGTPGSFLYLLPLGPGNSKRDNIHHWGYPEQSFWCCYGTAVESFAKLADSIYFWSPGKNVDNKEAGLGTSDLLDGDLPKLVVNQYVSSLLTWREMGMELNVSSTMYGPGSTTIASITVGMWSSVKGFWPSNTVDIPFTMLLRIPAWAMPTYYDKHGGIRVEVNGQRWGFVGDVEASSYVDITRRWKLGDVIRVTFRQGFWLHNLTDSRDVARNMTAIMMGPFVMAGLTHDAYWLKLNTSKIQDIISEPYPSDWLVSLAPSHNTSLLLRHDRYHTFVSLMADSGDAMDATFVLRKGCVDPVEETEENVQPDNLQGGDDEEEDGGEEAAEAMQGGRTAQAAVLAGHRVRKRARRAATEKQEEVVGQRLLSQGLRAGQALSLEAMNAPGFFLGASTVSHRRLIWQQRPTKEEQDEAIALEGGAGAAAGAGTVGKHAGDIHGGAASHGAQPAAGAAEVAPVPKQPGWCGLHSWKVAAPLDGSLKGGSFSLELNGMPGHFLSASLASGHQKCEDEDATRCSTVARKGLCVSQPHVWVPQCPLSCKACVSVHLALQLVALNKTSNVEARRWATWRFAPPAMPRYHPGAKFITGTNRRFVLAPLGSLVDERYTVYWHLDWVVDGEEADKAVEDDG